MCWCWCWCYNIVTTSVSPIDSSLFWQVLAYLVTSTPTPSAVAAALGSVQGDVATSLQRVVAGSVNALGSLERTFNLNVAASFVEPQQLDSLDEGVATAVLQANTSALLGGFIGSVDSDGIRYSLATYHLFGMLWLIALINAIAWTSMSGAVSQWFFYRDDPSERSCLPVRSPLSGHSATLPSTLVSTTAGLFTPTTPQNSQE